MNHFHFCEWWDYQLLSKLPPGAVIVRDNASYHTVQKDEFWSPTSPSTKAEMQAWLTSNNVAWTADMLKVEL